MKTKTLVFTLGTNTRQHENMAAAKRQLREHLPGIIFSANVWTDPIGIESDQFLNCVAMVTSTLPPDKLNTIVQEIENSLGGKDHENNIVNMDIDLLQYGQQKLKKQDWQRPYVTEGIKEILDEE
jgi:2-amino-4-hydroxy-6-hydroxymethyldihydropteridine diphosphokinase